MFRFALPAVLASFLTSTTFATQAQTDTLQQNKLKTQEGVLKKVKTHISCLGPMMLWKLEVTDAQKKVKTYDLNFSGNLKLLKLAEMLKNCHVRVHGTLVGKDSLMVNKLDAPMMYRAEPYSPWGQKSTRRLELYHGKLNNESNVWKFKTYREGRGDIVFVLNFDSKPELLKLLQALKGKTVTIFGRSTGLKNGTFLLKSVEEKRL